MISLQFRELRRPLETATQVSWLNVAYTFGIGTVSHAWNAGKRHLFLSYYRRGCIHGEGGPKAPKTTTWIDNPPPSSCLLLSYEEGATGTKSRTKYHIPDNPIVGEPLFLAAFCIMRQQSFTVCHIILD